MLLTIPSDEFRSVAEKSGLEWVEYPELASPDYKKGYWQNAGDVDTKRDPDWKGYLTDGIPCLLYDCKKPDDQNLLQLINKQAHIARSYLATDQVVDLHVFVFLITSDETEGSVQAQKQRLEDDGKIARKCVAIVGENENKKTLRDEYINLLDRSPFSPIFRKSTTRDQVGTDIGFLDWERQLETAIATADIADTAKSRTNRVVRDEINNIIDPGENSGNWPRRLHNALFGGTS
jgi:hypothetical protein